MWESVDFSVSYLGEPVEGVLVRVFSEDGSTIYTEGTTGSEGTVSFVLPVGSFTARFYKFSTSFNQPQHFTVVPSAPGVSNIFDVEATVFSAPLANDPRLCRCSGFFRDLNGGPKRYLDIHIICCFNPLLLDGAGVVSERIMIRTDEDGYAQTDLIRGAKYLVTVEAMDCMDREIRVPDAPSANLPDVLLPVVDKVVLASPLEAIEVGGSITIEPTVYDSAGVPLTGTAQGDVRWSVEDTDIASVAVTETSLIVTGNIAGTTQLVATRRDLSIVRVPDAPITGVPIPIVVL